MVSLLCREVLFPQDPLICACHVQGAQQTIQERSSESMDVHPEL